MVQGVRVSDQRAEAYVRRLAEAELRRGGPEGGGVCAWGGAGPGRERRGAAQQARAFDAGVEAGGQPDPGPLVDGTLTKVVRAGWILIAAGALDQEFFDHFTADFAAAVRVRSRVLQDWERSRRPRPPMFLPPGRPPLTESPAPACPALSATPIGR